MAIALVLLLFAPLIAKWLRNSKAAQSKTKRHP
jgi:hypothetical protein